MKQSFTLPQNAVTVRISGSKLSSRSSCLFALAADYRAPLQLGAKLRSQNLREKTSFSQFNDFCVLATIRVWMPYVGVKILYLPEKLGVVISRVSFGSCLPYKGIVCHLFQGTLR